MSRSKPIWNKVTACIYGSGKSFGAKDTSEICSLVGSSSSNSHEIGRMIITRRFEEHPKYGEVCIFRQSVDDVILNEIIFENNNGKAGKKIRERTALKRMKGLK